MRSGRPVPAGRAVATCVELLLGGGELLLVDGGLVVVRVELLLVEVGVELVGLRVLLRRDQPVASPDVLGRRPGFDLEPLGRSRLVERGGVTPLGLAVARVRGAVALRAVAAALREVRASLAPDAGCSQADATPAPSRPTPISPVSWSSKRMAFTIPPPSRMIAIA